MSFAAFIQSLIAASERYSRLEPVGNYLITMIDRYQDCVKACEHQHSKRADERTSDSFIRKQFCTYLIFTSSKCIEFVACVFNVVITTQNKTGNTILFSALFQMFFFLFVCLFDCLFFVVFFFFWFFFFFFLSSYFFFLIFFFFFFFFFLFFFFFFFFFLVFFLFVCTFVFFFFNFVCLLWFCLFVFFFNFVGFFSSILPNFFFSIQNYNDLFH
jgi:hypothetical protein